jgi:hypothetical protein
MPRNSRKGANNRTKTPPKPGDAERRKLSEILVFGPRGAVEEAILARHRARISQFINELRLDAGTSLARRDLEDAIRLARVSPGQLSWHLLQRMQRHESARVVAEVGRLAKALVLGLIPRPDRGATPSSPQCPNDADAVGTAAQMAAISSTPAVQAAIRAFRANAVNLTAENWNECSVLRLLGYRVGASGATKLERRHALEACLVLDDTHVPLTQREYWGRSGSRRRLRAIRRMIELFISLAESRKRGDNTLPCSQWREDIAWMKLQWGS